MACQGEEEESSSWSDDSDDNKDDKKKPEDKELTEEEIIKIQKEALNSEWIKDLPMEKWNNEQLQAWAYIGTLTDLEKQALQNEFDGSKILKCNKPEQLMELLNISKSEAMELMEEIKVQQKISKDAKYAAKFNKSALKQQRNLDAMRWKSRPITKWTPEQTVEWIKSLRIQNKSAEQDIIQKIMDDNVDGEVITDCLTEVSIISQLLDAKPSIATIIFHAAKQLLLKAMSNKNNDDIDDEKKENELTPLQSQYRHREINIDKYPHIVLSKEADIIMKLGPDSGIPTAKMPGCGHAIGAETLYFYIKTTFEKYLMATEIFCPDPKCQQPWDWSYCVSVADMNDEEIKFWNTERSQRLSLINFRKCPFCGKMCDKPDNLGTLRILCDCGSGKTFCWICSNPWKSGGDRACGNEECTMVKNVNQQLKNAKLFKPMRIGKYNGKEIKVPELRACPICMTLINHEDQDDSIGHHCKHIKCPVCKDVRFCFVCLGIYDKNKRKWPCGSYTDGCPPRPRQQFK